MYSLVVVDDEPAIRRGLTCRIDWSSIGFEVVDSFEDGEDVIAYLGNHHVDVVLTDVRMSVVSGLSLAETIHKQGLDTEVVLLSGYRDFEYAQQALKFGVSRYLLKPTDVEELRSVFVELREKIALRRRSGVSRGVRQLIADSRKRLFARIVAGLLRDTGELEREWRRCALPPFTGDIRVSYAVVRLAEASVLHEQADRLFVDYPGLLTMALVEPPDLLHFLSIETSSDSEHTDAIHVLRKTIDSRSTGLGGAIADIVTVRRIERLDELSTLFASVQIESFSKLLRQPEEIARELLENPTDVASSVEAVVQETLRVGSGRDTTTGTRLRSVRRASIRIVSTVDVLCRQRAVGYRFAPFTVNYEDLFGCVTIEEIVAWESGTIHGILEMFTAESDASRRDVIARVKDYIHQHYSEEISLEEVARQVYLSPAYLSRRFHEESGQTFLDALTQVRIDRACTLLAESPAVSVASVARAVGYRDSKYFTRVFRKRTDYTPSDYRRELARS